MGRTKQETMRIERRRELVAEHYLKGWSQPAIATELAVSQGTISGDLKAIRKQWLQSQIRDFDELVAIELKKIDRLEREAWAGWERSQQQAESTKVSQDGARKRAEKTVRQQPGDTRFLEQVHKCIASRRALLGLDAPTKIAATTPSGKPRPINQRQINSHADEEWNAAMRAAMKELSDDELRVFQRVGNRAKAIIRANTKGGD